MTANDLKFTQRMYPGLPDPAPPKGCADPCLKVYYDEKLEVGYRRYDSRNIEPAYAFGHGRSYTSFAYGNLTVSLSRVTFDVRILGSHAEVARPMPPLTAEVIAARGFTRRPCWPPVVSARDAPLRRQDLFRFQTGSAARVGYMNCASARRRATLVY